MKTFVVNIYNNANHSCPAAPHFEAHFSKEVFKANDIRVAHHVIPTNGYQRIKLIAPNGDVRELQPLALDELTEVILTLSGINVRR
jgi:hypothetical protein